MIWIIGGLFIILSLLVIVSLHSGMILYSMKNSNLGFQLDDKSLIDIMKNFKSTKDEYPYVGYLYEMYSVGVLWVILGIFLMFHRFLRDFSLEFGFISLMTAQLAFLATYGGIVISIKDIADNVGDKFLSYFYRHNYMTSVMSTCTGIMGVLFMFTLLTYMINVSYREMFFHYLLLFTFISGTFMFMGVTGWKINYVTKSSSEKNESPKD